MPKKSTPKVVKVTKVSTKVPKGTNYASKVDMKFNPLVTPKKLPKQDDNAILIPIDKRRKRK
jgi:hypothetical protein